MWHFRRFYVWNDELFLFKVFFSLTAISPLSRWAYIFDVLQVAYKQPHWAALALRHVLLPWSGCLWATEGQKRAVLLIFFSHGYFTAVAVGLREAALSAGLRWRFVMSYCPEKGQYSLFGIHHRNIFTIEEVIFDVVVEVQVNNTQRITPVPFGNRGYLDFETTDCLPLWTLQTEPDLIRPITF